MTKKEIQQKKDRLLFLGYKILSKDITQEEREEIAKLRKELDSVISLTQRNVL